MDVDAVRTKIKQAIHRVAGIEVAAISDTASYETDLGLDSLSILEISVELENQFKFHASDEELSSIHTVQDAVDLVTKRVGVEVA
ncbi:MAG TPA: acyl carrier protein [Candidatus Angelobacter sp.]|jgi:acyl carrier protein|nr:acyl carrier protein [Candidatus Angelobacter sp.]